MTRAKHPGIGRGNGGGRPRRGPHRCILLRLTPEAAGLLAARSQATRQTQWRITDGLIRTALGGQAPRDTPQAVATIAAQARAFLETRRHDPEARARLLGAWRDAQDTARMFEDLDSWLADIT